MNRTRRRLLAGLGASATGAFAGCLGAIGTDERGTLAVEWEAGTTTEYNGNHHGHAVAIVDGAPVVAISRNDLPGEETCGVAAFDADGGVRWEEQLVSGHCGAHAVGYIGVGDLRGDGSPAFLVATETLNVLALDADTGEVLFQEAPLDTLGFGAPATVDFAGDGTTQLAVIDFTGPLYVLEADGSVAWTADLEEPAHVGPLVGDFVEANGQELVVSHGRFPCEIVCFDGTGEAVWRREQEDAVMSWSRADAGAQPAIAATDRRTVRLLDAGTGETQWSHTLDANAAVGPAADGRLFVTSDDGTVHGLDLEDGETSWTTRVSEESVRMRAPTVLDPTGDGTAHVAANTHEGTVALFAGDSGDLVAAREFDTGMFTPPRAADVTGDGRDEIVVFFGDARVGALSYDPASG